ncbi:MAG: hypothetical protein ACI9OJ_000466, partial [Myxococcota bacterium]
TSGCRKRPAELVKEEQAKKNAERAANDAGVEAPLDASEDIPKGCKTELIQAAIKPHREAATRCYRQVLAKNPAAAGKLAVEIHLSRNGKAKFLGVQTDEFNTESFTRCIFDVLRPLQYPLPEDDQCVVVYPFVFSAAPPTP